MDTDNILEAGATPEADTTTTAAPAPELSADEQALAAMDQGFSEAAPVESEAAADDATPAADPAPTEATKDAPATDTAKPTDEKPARDEAIEKEITDRGLKGDSAERFRAMANEIRDLSPVKEALTKAGIKDLAELPQMVQHAEFGRELYKQVTDTGASADQYGQALDYLTMVNRANSGDVKAAEACYTMMQGELATLAKMLGKEVPGIHDPLADHADLKLQVEEGDITREKALEMARLRNTVAMTESQRQNAAARQTAETQQTEAVTKASADLDTLGQELSKIDPHFTAKAPVLIAQLKVLKDTIPPDQWVAKARALYATIPAPAAATPEPTTARVQPGPMRGSTLRAPVLPQTDDPMEALEQAFRA